MSDAHTTAAPRGGFRLWFAVFGSIAAWLAHLIFESSFTRYTCNAHGSSWAQHAATGVTAAVTVLALAWSYQLLRASDGAHEEGGSSWDRTRFLALFGLITGAVNLLLILFEGSYAIAINSCR
jgi:chromate transport protein ChrA